jgi:hypothetical protein
VRLPGSIFHSLHNSSCSRRWQDLRFFFSHAPPCRLCAVVRSAPAMAESAMPPCIWSSPPRYQYWRHRFSPEARCRSMASGRTRS